MTWNFTLFMLHAFAFGALVAIFSRAPGGLQKILLVIAGSGFLWAAICYGAMVIRIEVPPELIRIGYMAGHFACLLSVLRIFLVDQERRCLPSSSPHSQQ